MESSTQRLNSRFIRCVVCGKRFLQYGNETRCGIECIEAEWKQWEAEKEKRHKGYKQGIKRCSESMFCEAFPCNPRPFALAIKHGCDVYGTNWIQTTEAKQILWTLMAMAFGQLAKIDLCDLWDDLSEQVDHENGFKG